MKLLVTYRTVADDLVVAFAFDTGEVRIEADGALETSDHRLITLLDEHPHVERVGEVEVDGVEPEPEDAAEPAGADESESGAAADADTPDQDEEA